ncbi:hypothetical protein VQ372_002799 [Salmonella enterica]|nr:hypothetical protein [Salmonella enterica]EMD4775504.1 hypothetical protein [Salmonella enterica]EMD4794881.1 hypothetical protein [Salmonella enterica]EMD4836035.1 hypothetical protein [Salmonella enterica]
MNTFPIDLSYLLLIGSIVLAVFIVQLPLLIKDYLHKRRKRNSSNIEWQEVHINMYGHVKRRDYQKIATGNYKARKMNDRKRIVAARIITKATETLQIANMRLANHEYLVVSAELMETARSLKTVARQLRELHDLTE